MAFVTGILLAAWLPFGLGLWWLFAGISAAVLVINILALRYASTHFAAVVRVLTNTFSASFLKSVQKHSGRLIFAALLLLVMCFGGLRYLATQPVISPEFIAAYNDNDLKMVVTGVVVAPPDERDSYTNLRIAVERLRPENDIQHIDVNGLLLARVSVDAEWSYGDRVVVSGFLRTPPENEDFSYRDYLARQGVYSFMSFADASLLEPDVGNPLLAAVYKFKTGALDLTYRFWPDPEASLLAGILLGVESGIPQDVRAAFNDTGTSHVIAISGFNITIIAGLFSALFGRWLGYWRGMLVSLFGIAVYTLLVGADAAVVRAAIMGSLTLLARQVGRRQDGINSLAITAGIMALFNPHIPWDVGFQLSFAAVMGLVLYAEPLTDWFVALATKRLPEATVQRLVAPVSEYLLFTLAAGFSTLPIIAYHFQRLSLSSLPANAAILPAQPPIMIVGGVAVLVGMVYYPLGQAVAYLTWPFVVYTIRIVEAFAVLPGGLLVLGEIPAWTVILFYGLVLLLTFKAAWLRHRLPNVRPIAVFGLLAALTMLSWQAALSAPDGKLHITVLDVDSGDAVLIQTPEGRYILVGGGPSASRLSNALGRRLSLFNRQLDYLVVASPQEHQVAALPRVVERFPPQQVWWSGNVNASSSARYLRSTLSDAGILIVEGETGQRFDLGEGAYLEALAVSERGAVLLLVLDNFRVLLPIGLDFDALDAFEMGLEIGPVTALLLADSGYAPLNPPEWIDNLQPQVILLSVEAGNFEGLPDEAIVDAATSYNLLRTDHHGWIHLTTDGQQMWVEVEKNSDQSQ